MSRRKLKSGSRRRGKLLRTKWGEGPRPCGACDLCEKLGLPGLRVPPGVGCLWQRGHWGVGLESRPDRTNVVPWFPKPPHGPGAIKLWIKPSDPGAWKRGAVKRLVKVARERQGRQVFLNVGTEREYYVEARG